MKIRSYNAFALLVPLAAFLLYLPALRGGFAWDEINMLSGGSAFMPFYQFGYHRPLFASLLSLERALFGDSSVLYHIVNSALHAGNSAMVFLVARRLLQSGTAATVSALLFALHPVNSEAVAWVFAGSELLKTFLILVSLHLYLRFREDAQYAALIASVLFYLLACLAGQGALVLPLAVLAYEGLIGGEIRKGGITIAAYMAAIALYLAVFSGEGEILSIAGAPRIELYEAFSALGYYCLKLLLPMDLSLLPPLDDSPIYPLIALTLLALPFALAKRWKTEAFLASFLLIMLLPLVLVALSAADFPLDTGYLYPASMVFSMLVAMLLIRIGNRGALVALTAALAVFFAWGSLDRAFVWGDRLEVWKEAVLRNNGAVLHKINYAAALLSEGNSDDAMRPLRMALQDPEISNSEFKRIMEMLYQASPGSDDEMFGLLSEAKGEAKAYLGMGYYYLDLYSKDKPRDKAILAKAIKYLQLALDMGQSLPMTRFYLGMGYLENGQYDKSIEQLMAVNSMDPSGQYTSDIEYYLGLARRFKAVTGARTLKPDQNQLKFDIK